jgi:hypothetical protein
MLSLLKAAHHAAFLLHGFAVMELSENHGA